MALTQTQQQTLIETDRGTPMGELFRRYWIPAMLSRELPGPDCDPVQIKLLGEELLGFRDSNGDFGLIQEFCPHRGVSLFYGRNEECGIRCAYHGWKFDINGKCVDMPSEPDESNFKDKVRVAAYKMIERGGVLWAYMGPPEFEPPAPELEWALLPKRTAMYRSAFKSATIYKRSKAASTRATSRRCIASTSMTIRCTKARTATCTSKPIRGRSSKFRIPRADS